MMKGLQQNGEMVEIEGNRGENIEAVWLCFSLVRSDWGFVSSPLTSG